MIIKKKKKPSPTNRFAWYSRGNAGTQKLGKAGQGRVGQGGRSVGWIKEMTRQNHDKHYFISRKCGEVHWWEVGKTWWKTTEEMAKARAKVGKVGRERQRPIGEVFLI